MSDTPARSWLGIITDYALSIGVPLALSYYGMNYFLKHVNMGSSDVDSQAIANNLELAYEAWRRKQLIKEGRQNDEQIPPFPNLNSFEYVLASDMIFPEQLVTSFADIGGMERLKAEILETVLFPLINPVVFTGNNKHVNHAHKLISPPLGVLFYGPPGTGKTLMAKAIAKEAGCTFIVCNFSNLESKYYGDSEKYIRALFSLARKFSPSVIFVDECDFYFGKRGNAVNEASNRTKAEFLTLWDGILSDSSRNNVLVLGATNRPFDLDEAVLRRFTRQVVFTLPDVDEREMIIKVLLENNAPCSSKNIKWLSQNTHGYSPSDLHEVLRFAVMSGMREHVAAYRQATLHGETYIFPAEPNPIQHEHLVEALEQIKPTGQAAMEHMKQQASQAAAKANSGSGWGFPFVNLLAGGSSSSSSTNNTSSQKKRNTGKTKTPASAAASSSTASTSSTTSTTASHDNTNNTDTSVEQFTDEDDDME